jgi:hypothetical protein
VLGGCCRDNADRGFGSAFSASDPSQFVAPEPWRPVIERRFRLLPLPLHDRPMSGRPMGISRGRLSPSPDNEREIDRPRSLFPQGLLWTTQNSAPFQTAGIWSRLSEKLGIRRWR